MLGTTMTPSETSALIDKAGGDAAFGRLLGIHESDGWLQRVNNWRRRGLPTAVQLEHYNTIQSLRDQTSARKRKTN